MDVIPILPGVYAGFIVKVDPTTTPTTTTTPPPPGPFQFTVQKVVNLIN